MTEKVTGGEIFFALIFCLVVTWIAMRAGFYRLPSTHKTRNLNLKEVLGAFATYLVFTVVFIPLLFFGAKYIELGTVSKYVDFQKTTKLWFQLLGFFLIFLGLLAYLFKIKKETREEIVWGYEKTSTLKNMGLGALTLVVAYPVVLFISLCASYVSLHLFGKSAVEQSMVGEMKELRNNPLLFAGMSLAIIFIAPFVEELLFRGFLQSYLRRFLGSHLAIFITSLVFALAHYVKGGGAGNIALLTPLFVLAVYLGFIYERQRSLFASFGLHLTFNATTILAIALKS